MNLGIVIKSVVRLMKNLFGFLAARARSTTGGYFFTGVLSAVGGGGHMPLVNQCVVC